MRIGIFLARGAQLADQIEPRELWQAEVDHRDVERVFVAGEEAFFTVGCDVHREALLHQLFAQSFTQCRFILDDQCAHAFNVILPVSASTRTVNTRPSSDSSLST